MWCLSLQCSVVKADLARLGALDQWCLRRTLSITWRDHVTNIEVRARTDQPAISETIRQRRLAMIGHGSRMSPPINTYTEPSTNTCLLIGEDDPADPESPDKLGWQLYETGNAPRYVVIRGNLASNWTTFQSLLLTVHCGGEWLAALRTILVHAAADDGGSVVYRPRKCVWRLPSLLRAKKPWATY